MSDKHEHKHMHKPMLEEGQELDLGHMKNFTEENEHEHEHKHEKKPISEEGQELVFNHGNSHEHEHEHGHEHTHKHRHKRKKGSKIRSAVYIFLSFMLAFSLFLLSICLTLRFTVFSKDFMLNSMADTGYYDMVKDEMKEKFKNVGHASGLSDEFIDSFVGSMDILEIERDYISSFYSGGKTLVDTMKFKQDLLAAIDKYIEDNDIDRSKASESSISYLVDHMSKIYVNMISIPFFSVVGNYINKLNTPLRIAEIGLGVFALVIAAIIIFTNEYTHRRFRYLCYGFTGACLTVAVLPSVVLISGIIPKINLGDRSLYSLFVNYTTSAINHFWVYVGILAFFAAMSFAVFMIKYKKARGK